jgi:hypothetical protein
VLETLSARHKIAHVAYNMLKLVALLCVAPLTLLDDWWTSRQVASMTPPSETPPLFPPARRCYACSLFQTGGLGTRYSATPGLKGRGDWDEWMAENPKHILHKEGFDYRDFFTDVLSDPTAYVAALKAQGVTLHRFSLEWSVLIPSATGEIDPEAVRLYRQFIQALLKAGIAPSVTLCHFTVPDWFRKQGGFQKLENIPHYIAFASTAIELFPDVKEWWSFNEPGVRAFQQAREVFPTEIPEGSSLSARLRAAGISQRNMLIAHCLLQKKVQEVYPERTLGITHQWFQFGTATGNPLERIVAHLFTRCVFTPVFEFLKTGHYAFQYPFMVNLYMHVPKEEGFLTRLGVQAYPQVLLKMGCNWGKKYPGHPGAIKNFPLFSFGVTCQPGGTVMRLGARWHAEAFDQVLDQAFSLTDDVGISEYGSDAWVHRWGEEGFVYDDAAQADYFRQQTERIRDYCARTGRSLSTLITWSDLSKQLEWNEGDA